MSGKSLFNEDYPRCYLKVEEYDTYEELERDMYENSG